MTDILIGWKPVGLGGQAGREIRGLHDEISGDIAAFGLNQRGEAVAPGHDDGLTFLGVVAGDVRHLNGKSRRHRRL